jgi:LacI family transcriptional regulator
MKIDLKATKKHVDNGIKYDETYVIQAKSIEDGIAVTKLLLLKTPPDAIFSASDFAAYTGT